MKNLQELQLKLLVQSKKNPYSKDPGYFPPPPHPKFLTNKAQNPTCNELKLEGATRYTQLQALLQKYEDIFQEPNALPPCRSQDHCIPLKPGSQPPNLWPYRVPLVQQKWLSKLLGFDYEIHYKKGKENVVADALSRVANEAHVAAISVVQPVKWMSWLSLGEWWFNTNYHSGLKMTPFQALYGFPPPQLGIHTDFTPKVATVEEFLRLQPYRQTSVELRSNLKLSSKYYGPFEVLEKVGDVAYKLKLPEKSRIHPVFHVSQLKRKIGARKSVNPQLPLVDPNGNMVVAPASILDRRLVNKRNRAVPQVLIRWSHSVEEDATWEDYDVIKQQFPEFDA